MKKRMIILYLVGIVMFGIISYLIPNKNIMLPALCAFGFEKPLWLCVFFVLDFIYFWVLYFIYLYNK